MSWRRNMPSPSQRSFPLRSRRQKQVSHRVLRIRKCPRHNPLLPPTVMQPGYSQQRWRILFRCWNRRQLQPILRRKLQSSRRGVNPLHEGWMDFDRVLPAQDVSAIGGNARTGHFVQAWWLSVLDRDSVRVSNCISLLTNTLVLYHQLEMIIFLAYRAKVTQRMNTARTITYFRPTHVNLLVSMVSPNQTREIGDGVSHFKHSNT